MSTRLALAQINPTVGDLAGNSALILQSCRQAAEAGAQVVAFPEMALTGYPIEDLALRPSFQRATSDHLIRLAAALEQAGLSELTVVVGVLAARGPLPQNAAAVLVGGRVEQVYVKHHLPNYGVFDERRIFTTGDEPCVFERGGVRFSIAICEDLWVAGSPAERAATDTADVLLVLNASPFEQGKHSLRLDLCRTRAANTGSTVAYVNCVGGQDELVFDGGSMVVRPDGSVAARAARFTDELLVFDFDDTSAAADGPMAPELAGLEELYPALLTGLRDYVRKNGVGSVVLGLSGGIDSALVAALACDALGADNVQGVAMPSAYSSPHSIEDAEDLAQRTGLKLRTVPIAPVFDAFQELLHLDGVAEENLQARIRGTALMAISNSEGHLVLATGNKSELAVGYSTIYGDAVGGFGPIKDVPKTVVWELARWRNAQAEQSGGVAPIPPRSIEKPPSAELRPGQLDSDSLPDYRELDAILAAYVEGQVGAEDLLARGFDPAAAEQIVRLTDAAEYKRRQYPPGTKVTRLAFGRDRRVPITNRWREPFAADESSG